MSKLDITRPVVGVHTGHDYRLLATTRVCGNIRHVLQNTMIDSIVIVDHDGRDKHGLPVVENKAPVVTKRFLNVYAITSYWMGSRSSADKCASTGRTAILVETTIEGQDPTYEVIKP